MKVVSAGTGLKPDRGLELVFRFLEVVVEAVQAAQEQMVVHAIGLQFDNLLVLFDGQFQNTLRPVARLHVAQRAQIDSSEQAAGFEIIGIALENVLGFDDRVADTAGSRVKFGQAGGQVLGRGIGLNSETVFLDRLVSQFAASVGRNLLLVHMREGKVIIGGGSVGCLTVAWHGRWIGRFSGLVLCEECGNAQGKQRAEREQFFHQES